jgi:hypothetical protein
VFDDAKIAAFLVHGRGSSAGAGRSGWCNFRVRFAADLLQVRRGEMFDSIFGCDRGSPALQGAAGELNLRFICFAF